MSIKKTLAAAKAQSFGVVGAGDPSPDGGFFLTEDQVNAIEAALSENETALASLTTERDNALSAQKTAETNLATATTRISALETEVADLKKGPAASFTTTTAGEDPAQVVKADTKNKWLSPVDHDAAKYRK